MKKRVIAISDRLFAKAEQLRTWQEKSRNRLYSDAMAEYVEHHYADAITESINRFVDDPDAADPELDAFVAEAARLTLLRIEWDE